MDQSGVYQRGVQFRAGRVPDKDLRNIKKNKEIKNDLKRALPFQLFYKEFCIHHNIYILNQDLQHIILLAMSQVYSTCQHVLPRCCDQFDALLNRVDVEIKFQKLKIVLMSLL